QDWRHAASGKIDPRWLPMSDLPPGDRPGPQGETEKALADIYGEILGLESVSRETDFFAAGGHSLLAVQLVARIKKTFRVELPVSAIFEAPTLWQLAARITQTGEAGGEAVKAEIAPQERTEAAPLMPTQRRLWFLEQLHGSNAQYNMPLAIVVRGPFDDERLGWAFERLIERHEALRCIVADGKMRRGPWARL